MCGIAGVYWRQRTPPRPHAAIDRMVRAIHHRGPDSDGRSSTTFADVGFKRLSIIDLATGDQPLANENGTVECFLNGEIYNYLELREALAPHWRFRSASDTECILAAYDRHGTECLDRFRGMFAFALWDERNRRLFCARDRFGIKPFYYAVVGSLFVFASEAKALLPFLPEIATDPEALAEYLTFQYTIGDETLFRGVKQLLPGHALSVENGKVQVWRYWDVRYEIDFDHSARYFAPWLARWISTDPIAITGGINLYEYANSEPISLKDENGKQPTKTATDRIYPHSRTFARRASLSRSGASPCNFWGS